ncbi:MAG TPA: hypothetical protein VK403_09735 [Allosphingosinicella sp.]|nr:hypothetical protein [Allosphingosinicella sp.]
MRHLLWLAYGAALFLFLLIGQPGRAPKGTGLVAAQPIPANRLLKNEDIVLASGPNYIRRNLRKGERIGADDIQSWPSAIPPAGTVAVAISAPPPPAFTAPLVAGEEAILCPAPAGEPKRMKVFSVVCETRGEACLALIAASPEQAAALAAEQKAGRATTVRRNC